ncbi:PilZ domain-containing protein [Kaarinaea lacus]
MTERRHFPRYACEFDFMIIAEPDQYYPVTANDISEAGISLSVAQSVMHSLAEANSALEIGNKFLLAQTDRDTPASAPGEPVHCQVMHARRLSQDFYLIGAWFNNNSTIETERINHWLNISRHTIEE